jgi:hypothetical protein
MMRQLKKWISKRWCEFRFNAKAFDRFATRHLIKKRDNQAFKHRTQGFYYTVDPDSVSQFFKFLVLVVMAALGAWAPHTVKCPEIGAGPCPNLCGQLPSFI